ncbi:UNKNOWN [Stylonychia lemnae]|uniref:Uncharacterized protein n=1 Tax=Stylonychia lemnae TaxID=5949 RepID=A0A077ZUI0_STYLE|nr:UNKNOWN [Stylonychia lemnae]|eukprot:CDW72950.1 UNKNOWN [Stylonychia lemnae]
MIPYFKANLLNVQNAPEKNDIDKIGSYLKKIIDCKDHSKIDRRILKYIDLSDHDQELKVKTVDNKITAQTHHVVTRNQFGVVKLILNLL